MAITMKETLDRVTFYDSVGMEVSLGMGELIVTDDNAVTIIGCEIHPDRVIAMLRYGIKQCLADAGAKPKGTPERDRLLAMDQRADAIRNGTWGLRPARGLVDGDVFDAMVEAKLIADTEGNRSKWAARTKKERNVFRVDSRVVPFLKTDDSATDALLAEFDAE